MIQRIETAYKKKFLALTYRVSKTYQSIELNKQKETAKRELEYNRKLKRLEKRKETQYKNEKKKKQGKEIKKPVKKINRLKKADDIFSLYIRKKYGPQCYTCGGEGNNCGHRQTRMCRPLRRDERNCRPQGFRCCNSKTTGNGRPTEFEARLKQDGINVEELKAIYLERKAGGSKKPNQQEIREIFEKYKGLYEGL